MIDSAFIPNIADGVVQNPQDLESDNLAIVAINRSEAVSMESHYHTQTRLQKAWAKKAIAQWKPLYDSDEILDMIGDTGQGQLPSVGIEATTVTKVTASSRPISSHTARQLFEMPPDGIGIFKKRPVLMLGIDGVDARFSPIIGHELEHVRQWTTRPIQFIKSQNDANMQALRGELESANAGAAFAYAMLNGGYEIPQEETDEAFSVVHPIIIDQVRKEYRSEHGLSGDPFQPSGGLLRELGRKGFGAILHEAPDFALIQRLLGE